MIETDFLFDLLKPERLTTIVDIGANPIDLCPHTSLCSTSGGVV